MGSVLFNITEIDEIAEQRQLQQFHKQASKMIEKIEKLINVLQAVNGEIFLAINGYNPSFLEFQNKIINRMANNEN
ncbi:unnamed protein product [Meloidogyne enterolobii]|uniref:Uncharacterized protein n=1 Tax=Meloidogyne enterolobii TaxID=390850 RepID=A0ACB0XNJ5_MELEN